MFNSGLKTDLKLDKTNNMIDIMSQLIRNFYLAFKEMTWTRTRK